MTPAPEPFSPIGSRILGPLLPHERGWGRWSVWVGLWLLVTWVPLVVLTLFDEAVRQAFMHDLVVHARLWISGPILILLQPLVSTRLEPVSRHLVESGIVPEFEWEKLAQAQARLVRLRDSKWVPVALAVVALSFSLLEPFYPLPHWRLKTNAGTWFALVSGPLLRLLLMLWLWWIGLWGAYLLQVSKLRLHLVLTHPDGRGGIAMLGDVLTSFAWFTFAVGAPVAAQAKLYLGRPSGATMTGYLLPLAVVAVSGAFVLFAPLLGFARELRFAKRLTARKLAELAGHQADHFERRWFGRGDDPEVIRVPDFSSVEDLQSVFERSRKSEWIPFRLRPLIVVMAGAYWAAIPFLIADRELIAVLRKVLHAVG